MNMGDWIFTAHQGNKITGFLIDVHDNEVDIQVTIPKGYGVISLPVDKVWKCEEEITIWLDDIPALIDLSLDIGDKKWFEKWVHELSLWKPVSTIRELT